MRQQPPEEEDGLAGADIIEHHGAKDHAVVKEQQDGPEAQRHPQGEHQDRYPDVILHERCGERGLYVLKAIVFSGFLVMDTLGGIAHQVGELPGKNRVLRFVVDADGPGAEERPGECDQH